MRIARSLGQPVSGVVPQDFGISFSASSLDVYFLRNTLLNYEEQRMKGREHVHFSCAGKRAVSFPAPLPLAIKTCCAGGGG